MFSPKRENYTGTAEMDTVLAITTAPSSLHDHRRILLIVPAPVKAQHIREPTFGRVKILSIIGKWLILHSLN